MLLLTALEPTDEREPEVKGKINCFWTSAATCEIGFREDGHLGQDPTVLVSGRSADDDVNTDEKNLTCDAWWPSQEGTRRRLQRGRAQVLSAHDRRPGQRKLVKKPVVDGHREEDARGTKVHSGVT